jgi:hypothetical protein
MNTPNLPGFTAEVSLNRPGLQSQMCWQDGGLAGQPILPQMMAQARQAGDSENLLVCLGACLCCGLCDEGPWQRASCAVCRRCVAAEPVYTA